MKPTDKALAIVATLISVVIIALGAESLLNLPASVWGKTSMAVALGLLLAATVVIWWLGQSFFTLAAHLYTTVLVGRLFGTLRLPEDFVTTTGAILDPLLIGETGPGVANITYLSYGLAVVLIVQILRNVMTQSTHALPAQVVNTNDWALAFIRLYVGLMFIAHYSGHILAGPEQFQVFSDYFSGVGLHIGGPMVALAGVTEVAVSIGLVFGLLTRVSAVVAIAYLFFATLWGEHFSAGYIWILPGGGWEFSALWMAILLVFAGIGGGKIACDQYLRAFAPSWALRFL